jgi:hypothetical protein
VASCPRGILKRITVAQAKRDEGSPLLEERQDGLAALGAGQITAGCKCLNLPQKTVTSTSTPTTVRFGPIALLQVENRGLTRPFGLDYCRQVGQGGQELHHADLHSLGMSDADIDHSREVDVQSLQTS